MKKERDTGGKRREGIMDTVFPLFFDSVYIYDNKKFAIMNPVLLEDDGIPVPAGPPPAPVDAVESSDVTIPTTNPQAAFEAFAGKLLDLKSGRPKVGRRDESRMQALTRLRSEVESLVEEVEAEGGGRGA